MIDALVQLLSSDLAHLVLCDSIITSKIVNTRNWRFIQIFCDDYFKSFRHAVGIGGISNLVVVRLVMLVIKLQDIEAGRIIHKLLNKFRFNSWR